MVDIKSVKELVSSLSGPIATATVGFRFAVHDASMKTLANKGMNVPENIAKIIRAVYIEKTHTMKQYKKENDFAIGEFRKWMIEQKKKTKKDPLPPAKIEVVRKWLLTHPRQSQSYYDAKNKVPPVIMDECTKPVYGVSFGAKNAAKDGEKSWNSDFQ